MSLLDNPQEIPKANKWPTASRYGLLASLALIVIALIFHLTNAVSYTDTNNAGNWMANFVNWGIMIAGIVLATRKMRDEDQKGFATYGDCIGMGTLVSLVIAVIMVGWTFVFFSFVEPDLINTIVVETKNKMSEEQGLSDEQIEQSMGFISWMFSPVMFTVIAGFSTFITGVFFSLITSAILKKNPPE